MRRLSAEDYQTVQEYSKATGISPELVRRYCRTGRLKCDKIKNRWVIPRRAKVLDYEPRLKEGKYIGMSDLRNGDIHKFLRRRGIIL